MTGRATRELEKGRSACDQLWRPEPASTVGRTEKGDVDENENENDNDKDEYYDEDEEEQDERYTTGLASKQTRAAKSQAVDVSSANLPRGKAVSSRRFCCSRLPCNPA